jgi:hypothetical protein
MTTDPIVISSDPLLGVSICEVFAFLASSDSPTVRNSLLHGALPHLSEIMKNFRSDPFAPSVSAAMDLIDSVFGASAMPLPAGMLDAVASSLFEVLATSEDRDMVQSGLRIITTVVRKDVNQLLNW